MGVPVALGMAIAFGVNSAGTFEPQGVFGHEVHCDSLTLFVSFLLSGRWLEARLPADTLQSTWSTARVGWPASRSKKTCAPRRRPPCRRWRDRASRCGCFRAAARRWPGWRKRLVPGPQGVGRYLSPSINQKRP